MSAAFAHSEVREWFEYGGEPYRFRIDTMDGFKTMDDYRALIRAINTVKNTRSWLDGVTVYNKFEQQLYYGLYTRQVRHWHVCQAVKTEAFSALQLGTVILRRSVRKVRPELPVQSDIKQNIGCFIIRRRVTKVNEQEVDG